VRVHGIGYASALLPRLRILLQWTLGHMSSSRPDTAPTPYEIDDVGGEVSFGTQGPVVGRLIPAAQSQRIRSYAYVTEQPSELLLDLDWYRYERIEEYRQGRSLDLWLQLWGRAYLATGQDNARIEGFTVRVPQEDWLAVHSALTGDTVNLLEIRYHLSYADQFRASLLELRQARSCIDQGDFFEAVVRARKAILLVEPVVKAHADQDLRQALARLVDDRHAEIYSTVAARLKDMGNVQVHSGSAPGYSRAEALFAVRATELMCELVGALVRKPRRPPPTA
jgi:hypothetical protein